MSLFSRPNRIPDTIRCDRKEERPAVTFLMAKSEAEGSIFSIQNKEEREMKRGLTELVFILDKSGSMAGLESDTIGGFNGMIGRQKKEEGGALVSTVLFSNNSVVIHDRINVQNIPKMTEAIGSSIHHIRNVHRYNREEDRPEHTLFVITTDGYENASHKYSSDEVKKMIEQQKESSGWEFIFMGANIDAVETAKHFGIDENHAVNYIPDSMGVCKNVEMMSEAASAVRGGRRIGKAWKQKAEADYRSRSKKDRM